MVPSRRHRTCFAASRGCVALSTGPRSHAIASVGAIVARCGRFAMLGASPRSACSVFPRVRRGASSRVHVRAHIPEVFMLLQSFSVRAATLAIAGLFSLVACSLSTQPTGFDPSAWPDADASDGSSGSSGSSGSRPGVTAESDASASCADPTCPRYICDCDDDTFAATTDVCRRPDGSCDTIAACGAACRGAGFSGSSFVQKVCSPSAIECAGSFPDISCACKQGFGWNSDSVCKDGYCSSAKQDVCPKACAKDGGWAGCKTSGDCAPIICACKDGANPVTGAPCLAAGGGTCGPASGECPSLCAGHGGWSSSGSSGGVPDAGGTGPKKPGDPCNAASECPAVNCTCQDGNTFKNTKSCQNKQCATQAQNCNVMCSASGGWSGT